tara:strand:+ start:37 stop:669 length:633 start_codon:yes stop_codon:yes gene_type:complete
MSLASGGYYVKVAQIEQQLEALDVSAGNVLQKIEDLSGSVIEFKTEFQDLSAQVNAGGSGVGEVIAAFPLGRAFYNLNEEYVVEGIGKQDWSLTLAAGTYMFVFTPTAYLKAYDGSNPIWTSTNCNCNYLEYNLGNYELRMSIYPDLSVPVGNVGTYIKYLGKQTLIFTLATETTLGLTAKMAAPEVGVVVLDPTLFGYTISNINYVKLA